MGTSYCPACKRETGHARNIGVGTLLMVILTCGFWLLAIPVYSKKCGICW